MGASIARIRFMDGIVVRFAGCSGMDSVALIHTLRSLTRADDCWRAGCYHDDMSNMWSDLA